MLACIVATVALNVAAGRLADHNGDGKDDLLLRDDAGAWHYYAMDGRATLPELSGEADLATDTEWHFAGSGDFDGDGTDDVLLRHADGRWYYYAMDGGQPDLTRSGAVRMTRKLDWRYMGSGEFTGDGKDDVLLRHRKSGAWMLYPLDGRAIGDGRGFLNFTRNALWQFVGIADLDGDGRDGVLLRHTERHHWHYYYVANRRAAAGSGWIRLSRDPDWRLSAIADFNGDGKDDVLLRRASDGEWRYYPMDGRAIGADEGMADLPTGATYRLEAAGDLNGDGRDDVLLRHASGSWHYYPMNGRVVDEAGRGELPILTGWTWSLAGSAGLWDERVDIVDTALRTIVAEALGAFEDDDGDGLLDAEEGIWAITPDDMARLTHLVVPAGAVRDLAGLQFAVNLSYLYLTSNAVTDLAPLAGLTEMQFLVARDNAISDVQALAGLTALTALYLQGNDIDDVTPLGTLTNLRHLRLDANAITDVAPLVGLRNLRSLGLDHNDVADLAPLATMTSLTELHLDANAFDSLAPLAALNGLSVLGLDYNGITDLEPLSTLTNLTDIYLRGNRIGDLSPLARLTRLTYVYLDANEIVQVGALASLNLHHLSLSGNAIVDIGPLASTSFSHNPVLDLSSNDIEDISPLRGKNLFSLDVSTNGIRDFSPLVRTLDIEHLAIHNNPITDLSPLSALPELVSLSLGGGEIALFTPLRHLVALQSLSIRHSAVDGIEAFGWHEQAEVKTLGSLELLGTGTTDLDGLAPDSDGDGQVRFVALRNLALRGNGIDDVGPLADLAAIEALDITDNDISDLTGLADRQALTYLALGNNPVADIAPLASVPALRSLIAGETLITDLGPLGDLADLHEIRLEGARITDLTPLAGLRGADAGRRYGLYLSRNTITDLSPLTEIANLGPGDVLRVDGNPLDGDATEVHIPALRERGVAVHVSGDVDIRDRALRARLQRQLGMMPTDALNAADMLALTDLVAPGEPFWWRWDVAYAPIRDLTGIEGAANLRRLHLDGQDIADLTPLAALANLDEVRLNYNRVENIGPLVDNPSLGVGDVVRLRGNPLSAESTNTHVPALQARGVVVHH